MTSSVYANVIVDIQARELKDRLFTYRVPPELSAETFIGAQVLVPFGPRELVGGYVVSLSDHARADITIKDIAEIVEPEPLFDCEYVDFLYWIADYYCASLSDVISAAVPAMLSARYKRVVKLINGYDQAAGGSALNQLSEPASRAIVEILAGSKTGALAHTALKQRWRKISRLGADQFYRALNYLRQEGFVTVVDETTQTQAPKTVTVVMATGVEGTKKKHLEILQALSRSSGQLTMKELSEQAGTTPTMIRRMKELGMVDLMEKELVRDPLKALSGKDGLPPVTLTDDQRKVLDVLSRELAIILENRTQQGNYDPVQLGVVSHTTAPASNPLACGATGATPAAPQDNFTPAAVIPAAREDNDRQACAIPNAPQDNIRVAGAIPAASEDNVPLSAAGSACQPWLLHGVTGSGKTEVYLRLIQQAIERGHTALLLVPEISLTPQLARRLKSRFGDLVAVWHSALSDGERYDTWRRLRSKEVRVLLGARSAILANLPDVSLIILDEEHDGSYKQSTPSPRYNAKEVALERARRTGAMVLLGSATPDVAVYLRAQESGRLLTLPERVLKQAMPEVTIVDMRQEFSFGNRSIFSRLLENRLSECFKRGEQAILLMNRRGYASHVFCRACGYVVRCRNCSVSMVFHQPKSAAKTNEGRRSDYLGGFLSCHHCGFTTGAFQTCPSCKSPFIKQYGLGTQKVEEEVKQHFPQARILRLDSDVTARKGAHEEVLQEFARGDADVLIGTQMVAKGLDIHNVTTVGILAADTAFNLPDYRAMERGFQLLTQVAGRAGRGDRKGSVVLQTYNAEMPVLAWAKHHDYLQFMQEELAGRQAFGYPPFCQLLRIVVTGPDATEVQGACDRLAEEIGSFLADKLPLDAVRVLGPAPCLIERLRGKFRYHLLVKNFAHEEGRVMLTSFLRNKPMPRDLNMAVDVDALDLL